MSFKDMKLELPTYICPVKPSKPWRQRVEVYAISGGMVYGGLYDEVRNFGGFGGGVEPGETLIQTAVREFQEETAWDITDVFPVPVAPFKRLWREGENKPNARRQHCGSETHYFFGQLGGQLHGRMPTWGKTRTEVGLYPIKEALRRCIVPGLDELRTEANAKRHEVVSFLEKLYIMFTL